MTPSSLTPRTPISNTDKPFYNPFTVDISLDNINTPITGAYNVIINKIIILDVW